MLSLTLQLWLCVTWTASLLMLSLAMSPLLGKLHAHCAEMIYWAFGRKLYGPASAGGYVLLFATCTTCLYVLHKSLMLRTTTAVLKVEMLNQSTTNWKSREISLSAQRDGLVTVFTLFVYLISIRVLQMKIQLVKVSKLSTTAGVAAPNHDK
ncbi:hypothetical protein AaE_005189 [Aphanomyces astaci]|uniref:Uncharacterized protein n=1 Tax=Aphanomyces astaci TaxID=112090 RepID=A0A6A5A8J2_APHAT|nr:hypothetical protein AaE_005189 [Aphanomyces astaci]